MAAGTIRWRKEGEISFKGQQDTLGLRIIIVDKFLYFVSVLTPSVNSLEPKITQIPETCLAPDFMMDIINRLQ
jgi:hypothetical protein